MGLATYWKQHRRTIGTVLLCIPCINFWTQFLFSTPSYSSTEAVLQVEGLVCALMLAVALGLPGTVSVSELRAADQFFGWFRDPAGPPPTPEEEAAAAYYKTIIAFWRERPPSFLFGYYLAISGFCLSVAILVIIVQYVYLSQARGLSPPGTDLSTTMLYYYRWVRAACVAGVACGAGGWVEE
ncbi:hypothetical protein HXX76_014471 [Chlamydomonas incerta]|uniref:Uncharacterized protein n=1 Tax=Chlamydomonas incerta TaxID=51695 RepID=A0A835SBV5_CHLIN|nr:hypothetical protein HXX76_014471 [Chlamydomonas incerta]|eukprot:KAG2424418.1 hypothetical protein HXX76_014471 [Chlamydomonas incerta]